MSYQPPADRTPASFKTNVNRAKTKRWVEAKSYSYDGDDWGDADEYDEYGGYDEPATSVPPKPTGLRQQGQSATQSAQAPRDVHNESQPWPSDRTRHGLGNTGGAAPVQQKYGARSATNPQPQVNTNLARSNSFDRGDERRAFSGPGPYQNLSDNREYQAASQQYAKDPTSQQGSYQPPPQQSYQTHPSQQASMQFPPYQRGNPQVPRPVQMMTGNQQLQSPIQLNPNQQTQVLPEPGRPPLQRGRFSDHEESQGLAENYGGVSYSDPTHNLNSDDRTRSMASNSSLVDMHNRNFSPSAVPPPPQTQSSPSPQRSFDSHSSQFPPRKSSLSQENQPNIQPINQSGPASTAPEDNIASSRDRTGSNASNKPLPFVRPADIYKRMQEEKERERKSQDSSRPSMEAITNKSTGAIEHPIPAYANSRSSMDSQEKTPLRSGNINTAHDGESNRNLRPVLDPVTERKSEYGIEGYMYGDREADEKRSNILSNESHDMLRPVLPDVARMSGFGDLFRSTAKTTKEESEPQSPNPVNSSAQGAAQGPSQGAGETDLQHQPSSGFRSVVHQAFDQVPATPSSTSGSGIGRSTSGGTSVVSPIISRGPSLSTRNMHVDDSKMRAMTPTMEEISNNSRPLSSSSLETPKQRARKPSPSQSLADLSDPIPPTFIPGHRRDTSTPSPNNSPARTPAVEFNRQLRQPQEAELAVVTPIEPTFPTNAESQPSEDMPRNKGGSSAQGLPFPKEDVKPFTRGNSDLRSPFQALSELDVSDPNHRLVDSTKDSPTTPLDNSQNSANSPSKTRVRDLAGKFESSDSSRPGSAHSVSQPTGSPGFRTQKMDSLPQIRPSGDRLESFRPQLPGGWESFTSSAPISAQTRNENSHNEETVDPAILATQPNKSQTTNIPLIDTRLAPLGVESNSPRVVAELPSEPKAKPLSNDPFSAVAAAGTALAGALVAAVGMEKGGSYTETNTGAFLDKSPDTDLAANVIGTMPSQVAPRNTALHPEASRPPVPMSEDDGSSSGSPTPPPKESLHTLELASGKSQIASSAEEQPGGNTIGEDIAQHKNQIMLPPLSTNTNPSRYESDRLRREIVKDLSPRGVSEPTTAESESPWQDDSRLSADANVRSYGHDSMLLPSEYESYWNESNSGGEVNPRNTRPIELEAVNNFNSQNIEPQISPTKPLQIKRGYQIADTGKIEKMDDTLARPTMQGQQYSWVNEPEEMVSHSQSLNKNGSYDISHNAFPHENLKSSEVGVTSGNMESRSGPEKPTSQSLRLVNNDQADIRESSLTPIAGNASRKETEIGQMTDIEDGVSRTEPTFPHENVPFFGHFTLAQPSEAPGLYPGPYQIGLSNNKTIAEPAGNTNPYMPNQGNWEESQNAANVNSNIIAGEKNLPLPPPPGAQPKIRAFREILALKTPNERIQAYNETRDQFANLNTGLAHWLAIKSNEFPTHAHVLSGSHQPLTGSVFPKPNPLKSKIAGLRSGGNQPTPQPYYQQYLGASPHTQVSDGAGGQGFAVRNMPPQGPSPNGGNSGKTSGQQVQTKGKDFLHSAGVFGGKANTAAKGLFSKGRIKLRGGGSGDKHQVTPTTPNFEPLSRGMQPQYQPQVGGTLPNQSSSRAPPHTETVSEVSPSLSERLPNQSSQISEPADVVGHPRFSTLYERLPSPIQTVSPSTSKDLQIATATSGSNDPITLHTAVSTGSYHGGPPDLKTPYSNTSSNQTPTQPDFDNPGHNEPVSSTSVAIRQPQSQPKPSSEFSQQPHQDFISESQSGDSQQVPEEALPVTQSRYSSRQPRSIGMPRDLINNKQDPEHPTQRRLSQSSNGTFHTAGSHEQPQTDLRIRYQAASYHQPQFEMQKSAGNNELGSQGNFLAPPPPTQSREGTQTPDRPVSRPFSFMEVSPDRRSQPKAEILHHAPSIDSNRSDRPPSPVSPQRSMTRDVSSQHDQAVPSHHDTSQDSVLSDDQRGIVHRPRSFSRPFPDPNLQEHPAFRQEIPSTQGTEFSSDHYPAQVPHEGRLAQQYTAGFQAQGVEPPVVPPSENKTRSRRGSRSSTFFKNFASPARAERPPSANDPEGLFTESPMKNPVPGEVKNKRGSVFRSINSRRESTREKSGTSIDLPTQLPPPNLSRQFGSVKQQNPVVDSATRSGSSKARNKLQRASTSAAVEQEPGKKKRFSALGSLFGRSKHDKPRPPIPVTQPSTFLQNQASFQSQQFEPLNQPQHSAEASYNSSQYAPLQEYYARPAGGEYYAPSRLVHNISGPRMQPARPMYPKPPEPPAYMQDTSLRQSVSRSQTTGPAAATRPSAAAAASKGFRSTSYTGSQRSFGSSTTGPGQFLQTGQAGNDSYPPGNEWSSAPSQANPPRRTWHTISSSAHSFTHTPPSRAPSPGPYFPPQQPQPQPPPHQTFHPSPSPNPYFSPQPQHHPRYPYDPSFLPSSSPAPPLPPPKDDYPPQNPTPQTHPPSRHFSSPPSSSFSPAPQLPKITPLPPLQTNISSSSTGRRNTLSRAEMRKSRQMEIELGVMPGAVGGGGGLERSVVEEEEGRGDGEGVGRGEGGKGEGEGGKKGGNAKGDDDSDEEIVMSSTSYPGMEWQPREFGRWEGD